MDVAKIKEQVGNAQIDSMYIKYDDMHTPCAAILNLNDGRKIEVEIDTVDISSISEGVIRISKEN